MLLFTPEIEMEEGRGKQLHPLGKKREDSRQKREKTNNATTDKAGRMTEGKTGSQRRSLRRHHDQRKKAWVRKNLTHYFYGLAVMPADRVGRYSRTPKVCSCFMCGNPRRYQRGPTLQERRALPFRDGIEW